jgi:hypothetical protein
MLTAALALCLASTLHCMVLALQYQSHVIDVLLVLALALTRSQSEVSLNIRRKSALLRL